MKKVSIVVPCYNEEECLPLYYTETCKVLEKLPAEAEFVFVDDGSKDGTLKILKELAAKDKRVRFVSFSRNFGKEAAMYAGLSAASGDYVSLMDVDLQDPPELLLEMYKGITEEGYDCVGCRRSTRKHEPVLRSAFSKLFYKLINMSSPAKVVDGARDFRLMTRRMTDAVLSLTERDRFSKEMFSWVGFNTKWLEYQNIERAKGKTKWNFKKLASYAIGGIEGATTSLLKINIIFCVLFMLAAVGFAVADIVLACIGQYVSALFIFFPVFFFTIALVFFGIFMQGEYIKRIYKQVQSRPIYIVKETEKDLEQ